jgi:5-methylcytosine-specific restriction endonuclease McrA
MQQAYICEDRSASQIAEELGISTNQVKKALALLGLRKTPLPEIDIEQLHQSYVAERKSLQDTADEFGVSTWTVMKWLAFSGISRRGHNDIDKGTWRGRHHTAESKAKISRSKDQGRRLESQCAYCASKFQYYEGSGDGRFCSAGCYNAQRAAKAKDWSEHGEITDSLQYRQWRLAVYERDNYRCRWCGMKPTDRVLHAHHIWPRSKHPHLVFEISNSITLCAACHYRTLNNEETLASLFESLLSSG